MLPQGIEWGGIRGMLDDVGAPTATGIAVGGGGDGVTWCWVAPSPLRIFDTSAESLNILDVCFWEGTENWDTNLDLIVGLQWW